MASALYKSYIIDGVQKESAPASLLDAVLLDGGSAAETAAEKVVDETLEPKFKAYDIRSLEVGRCLETVLSAKDTYPLAFSTTHTKFLILSSLIDAIWKHGEFRLGNLCIDAKWSWDEKPVGSMAAFYESCAAVAETLDALGLSLGSYSYSAGARQSRAAFRVRLAEDPLEGEFGLAGDPFRLPAARLSARRACQAKLAADPRSWVVYVPFDTADFRLGGSLLGESLNLSGAVPEIGDAEYFIDCYELVREFVEDKILLSAATVGRGGLMASLKSMLGPELSIDINVSDIMRAYNEKHIQRLLFSEVPGVIIQINDIDFDYLDAEMILQDVAYFPLGHPRKGNGEINVFSSGKSGIQTILESLMHGAEGED